MAYLPMISGGGAMTPTVLWTNPNSTARYSSGTATLSEDMNNYEYIELEFYRTTTNHDEIFKSGIYLVSDVITFSGNGKGRMIATFVGTGGNAITRTIAYVSNTSLSIGASSDTNALIPYRVVGYK